MLYAKRGGALFEIPPIDTILPEYELLGRQMAHDALIKVLREHGFIIVQGDLEVRSNHAT